VPDRLSRVRFAVTSLTAGEPVVVADESADEAVLVLVAEDATAAAVAFVVRHGSGFLCAATDFAVLQRLRIPVSPARDRVAGDHEFGISVDAVGTGTGISAGARAETLRRLADPAATPDEFVRPGHVMTVRVTPPATPGRPSLPGASTVLARAASAEPVACFTHLVGVSDPTGLAGVREAESFARGHGLAIVATTDLMRAPGGVLRMPVATAG
jgi:3,4-dihydroxy 2-butanone 4-phosphate synthase / GTP cyclohydrolase II